MLRSDAIIVDREFVTTTVEDIFLKYRAELIADLRDSLIRVNRDQPGDLLQSVDAFVKVNSNNISFELVMNDYWKFVDEGVDGYKKSVGSQFKYKKNTKVIPIDAIKKFIAARGIEPAMSISRNKRVEAIKGKDKIAKFLKKGVIKKNREDAFTSFAFAIGAKLKRDGQKPTHFFTDVINDDLKARLTKDITLALKKDIEVDFTTTFK